MKLFKKYRMKYTSLVNGLLLIILFFLVYLALFHNLGVLPIARWDEGLFAMRAYYLAENGHLLANFNEFPGMGDYHNLKPPLGTLIQAFSFQLFGYNSWALRFPIVLSTCLLLVVLTFQLKKVEGSWWPGILSTLILISSTGLIHTHVAKSGDHDVFYLLFMLLQVFSFFQITIETQTKQKDRTIILFFLSLLSAFLIKEIMAFFLLPAFLIFAIYSKTFIPLLTSKRMLLYGGVFVLLIVGYFFGMNLLIPDFLSHTVEEVWNRYSTSIEGHSLPWYYYLVQFGSDRFFPWIILSPLVFYDLATTPKNQLFSFKILLWTCLIWFFIVISYSATKMSWYAALTYPFGAMLLGLSFKHLISKVSSQIKLLLLTLFIGVFSFSFYQNIYQKVHQKSKNMGTQ